MIQTAVQVIRSSTMMIFLSPKSLADSLVCCSQSATRWKRRTVLTETRSCCVFVSACVRFRSKIWTRNVLNASLTNRAADKACLLGFVLTSVSAIVRLDHDARYGKGAGHRKREQGIASPRRSRGLKEYFSLNSEVMVEIHP